MVGMLSLELMEGLPSTNGWVAVRSCSTRVANGDLARQTTQPVDHTMAHWLFHPCLPISHGIQRHDQRLHRQQFHLEATTTYKQAGNVKKMLALLFVYYVVWFCCMTYGVMSHTALTRSEGTSERFW